MIQGAATGQIFPITKTRTTIGRSGADINLDDPEASRQHAVLEILGETAILRDLGSTNGTFVELERIEQQPAQQPDGVPHRQPRADVHRHRRRVTHHPCAPRPGAFPDPCYICLFTGDPGVTAMRSSLSFLVLTAAGCAMQSPASSSVPAGREFQVKAGESVSVQGAGLELRFSHVAQDSRCPADVVCVRMGDAEAVFAVTASGRPADVVSLHTEPGRGQRAEVGEWILTLSRLDPYPYASRPVVSSDYQATLRVDRTSP